MAGPGAALGAEDEIDDAELEAILEGLPDEPSSEPEPPPLESEPVEPGDVLESPEQLDTP
jgi:hypothetical protein